MLTKRQKQILDFVVNFIKEKDYSPSLEEIKHHFRLNSVATVHEHVELLRKKGYLKKEENQPRGIEPYQFKREVTEIPLMGTIAAGQPILAFEEPEPIKIHKALLASSGNHFALRVKGDSMIEEGIFDGDIVIIKQQSTANRGDTVVALLEGENATLKKFYQENGRVRLQSANPKFSPIFTNDLIIQGKVVSVIRNLETKKEGKIKEEVIKQILELEKKNLGAFYTPPKTVSYMVSQLGKIEPEDKILEPCGGDGVFVKELIKQGVNPKQITVWDINPAIREEIESLGVSFECVDTLIDKTPGALFSEKFDFIIGNPPYLNKQSSYIKEKKSLLQKIFKEIGCHDTYAMFIYRSLELLNEGGILCFITSDTFLSLGTHEKLREFILNNTKIKEILLAPKNLFTQAGASVTTSIITLEKCFGADKKNDREENMIRLIDQIKNEDEYYQPQQIFNIKQENYNIIPGKPFFFLAPTQVLKIFNEAPKITLVMDGHIGMHTHNNHRFLGAIEGTKLAQFYRIKNEKINKGESLFNIISKELIENGQWHLYLKNGGKDCYYAPIEECVAWDKISKKHYDIPRGNHFLKEGIVISGVSTRLSARYMPKGCLWDTNKAIGFVPISPKISLYYLLGLLNSKLYNYFIKGILNTTNSVQIEDIRRLPFITPTNKQKITIESLVKNIIRNKKRDLKYNYEREQNEIDKIIFEIYRIPDNLKNFITNNF